jgi:hypothetical protein
MFIEMLVALVLFFVLACSSQTKPPGVIGVDVFPAPVPPAEETLIIQTAPNVPEYAKAFLGVHSGRWWRLQPGAYGPGDLGLRYYTLFTLYVTKVELVDGKIQARVIYAEGKSQNRLKESTWELCEKCLVEVREETGPTLFVSLKKRKKQMKFFFAEGKMQGRNLSDPLIAAMF